MSSTSKRALQTYLGGASAPALAHQTTDSLDLANDILEGAQQIASFLGDPVERVRYMIRRHQLPVYRRGARLYASKRVLIESHLRAAKGDAAA